MATHGNKAGGRPNRLARVMNRTWAFVARTGLWPNRLVTLQVRPDGGDLTSTPLVVANHDGGRYLVAIFGEKTRWVANVRAAGGQAVLRRGRREAVHLQEVVPAERAPILRRYLDVSPRGRALVPVDRAAPLEEYERIAAQVPIFRITTIARLK